MEDPSLILNPTTTETPTWISCLYIFALLPVATFITWLVFKASKTKINLTNLFTASFAIFIIVLIAFKIVTRN